MRKLAGVFLLCLPLIGGSIEGRVTNRVTGAGIEGVSVNVAKGFGPPVESHQVLTGATGMYRIDDLPDGEYMVLPHKYEFLEGQGQLKVKVSGETRLDLQMSPLPSLRGRVLDDDDKPVEGITVKLTGAVDTVTDENGSFLFETVMPGSRTLCAIPKPQEAAPDEERLVTTCYPSVVGKDRALEIKVADTDLFGFEIRLRTAPLRLVRGVVVDADGNPEQNATVVLYQRASQAEPLVILPFVFSPVGQVNEEHLLAGDDGSFEFLEVAEGDWLVRALAPTHEPESLREGVAELKVGRSDIKDVQIHTNAGFPIDISADFGDSPPAKAPPIPRLVNLASLDGQFLPGSGGEGFAGRYFVGPSLTVLAGPGGTEVPGYYLAAVMLGNQDVLGQVVDLSGPTSLKLIFKNGGGSVRGTVENGENASVALMADGGSTVRFGFWGMCNPAGEFAISDLPPGEYTAVALKGFGFASGRDAEILSLLASNGKRVKVEAGASVQLDLRAAQPQP
jgi:hypothetical protein